MFRKNYIKTLILSCFLLTVFSAFAQQTRTYDSIYQPAPGITGEAQFEYILNDEGERIKNGEFLFEREVRDSLTPTTATYNRWEGQFNNNIKVGSWLYETKNHKVEINEISEINLDYDIFTEDEILEINYAEGFPEGELFLESTLYINNNRVKNLKYFETEFIDGRMNGDFEFILSDEEKDLVSVIGEVSNGLMSGLWEFNYHEENLVETREYDRGILLRLTKTEDNEIIQELNFPLSEGLQAALNNEETNVELVNNPLSLRFSDGYPRTSEYIKAQEKGEEVIEMIFDEIFQYDENIDPTEQLPLGTNRGFYPLSSEEQERLEEWTEVEATFRNNIQQLKNLEIDNLDFVEDPDIQTILKWSEKQEELEEYIKPWNNILSKAQAEFYNREGLLVDYSYNLLQSDTLQINDEEVILEYEPREKGDNFLLYIVENFKDRNKMGDSLIKTFSVELEELEINQEISEVNKQISRQKEEVDSIYEFLPEHEKTRNTLYNVKSHYINNVYPDEFEEFTTAADEGEQVQAGRDIIVQLELLKNIRETGEQIAERHLEVDSLYTDYTFDPFTYSDRVPVRRKKRLYNLVNDDIINRIIDRANSSYLEPREVLKDLQLAYQMQERLIFLEDKNTSRLERRLRRSDSLNERIELLNSL